MAKTAEAHMTRLRISIQADMLSSSAGSGRFTRGFLGSLFSDADILNQIDHVYVVMTQNESAASLEKLPARATRLTRRFPWRLRHTPLARLFGYLLPPVDVAFGAFYHVFPSRAKVHVVTVHDLLCFNECFHAGQLAFKEAALLSKTAHMCDSLVCTSNATLHEFQNKWPHLAHKAVMIYDGVSAEATRSSPPRLSPQNTILAVGAIEPRKNYSTLLDAYERLLGEQGDAAPRLNIVGGKGWLSDDIVRRIMALQTTGKCEWRQNISDAQLADAYNRAGVFTYLSLCEGFGYPPFEAAFAECPMILSNASSVGEIWSRHATCVDPLDVDAIVAAWKWALGLSPSQRETVAAIQKRRAQEFTWKRTVEQYITHWQHLLTGMKP